MDEIQLILEEASEELAGLEVFMTETLSYTAKIDKSFNRISLQLNQYSEDAMSWLEDNEKILFKDKRDANNAMCTAACISVGVQLTVRGVGKLLKEYEKKKACDKLLKLKQDIANEKRETVMQIKKQSERNVSRFEMLMKSYASQKYILNEVGDLDSQKRQMMKIMKQYGLSYFIYKSLDYLLAEYDAWLQGKQDPEVESPIMFDVNAEILNQVLFPSKPNGERGTEDVYNELGVFFNNNSEVTGRILFVILDEGLMALYLATREDPLFLARYRAISNNNAIAEKLLKSNSSFQKSVEAYNEYHKIESKGDGTAIIHSLYALLMTAFIVCTYLYCEEMWLKIVVMVIGIYILGRSWYKRTEKAKIRFQEKLSNVKVNITKTMLVLAGDAPRKAKIEEGCLGMLLAILGTGLMGLGCLVFAIIALFF